MHRMYQYRIDTLCTNSSCSNTKQSPIGPAAAREHDRNEHDRNNAMGRNEHRSAAGDSVEDRDKESKTILLAHPANKKRAKSKPVRSFQDH